MNNYKKCIALFLKRFLLIVLIYQLSRALFYFMNLDLFDDFTIQTFTGGILFDLAAISYYVADDLSAAALSVLAWA